MFCEAILQVFSNFAYLFCLLRKEEEQFANYEGVFFLLDDKSAVFLVLIKCLNWIAPFLGKQHDMLVYLEILGPHQTF